MRAAIALFALAGCASGGSKGTPLALRVPCTANQFWDGSACKPRGDFAPKIAAGKAALTNQEPEQARAAFDAAAQAGPLDYDTNVELWQQRGIAAAYGDDEASAASAFDMLLALDPSHFLSYRLVAPKATWLFEKVRNTTKARGAPALDVNWEPGQKVGEPVPLDVQVIADPKQFLRTATVFVRTRGEPSWRAADVVLSARERRVVLPPIVATKPVSLELYLRAYDDRGNEVLAWADPARPREIPLRYDPPTPWYRRWYTYAIAGSAVALGTGIIVYAVTIAPPDKVDGSTVVD